MTRQTEDESLLLRAALDHVTEAVAITTATGRPSGPRIVYVNRAFSRVSGYPPDEMVGRPLRFLEGIRTDRSVLARVDETLQAGREFTGQVVHYRKGGQEYVAECRVSSLPAPDRTVGYWLWIEREVSRRKRVEEALRDSQRLIQKISDTTPALIYMCDVVERRNVYCNQHCAEFFGTSVEEIVALGSRLFSERVHPEDQPTREAQTARYPDLADGEVLETEFRMKRHDGKWRWLQSREVVFTRHIDGLPQLVIGTSVDVTDRKRAEEKLAWEAAVKTAEAHISKALMESTSIEDVSGLVLGSARRLTSSPVGFAGYVDPHSGHLVCPAATPGVWDTRQVPGKGVRFEELSGLWEWVLENRRSLLTNNSGDDSGPRGVPSGQVPIDRFVCAPALIGDSVLGVLSLANADRDYTDRDLVLVERLAVLYALAIQRKRSEEAVRESRDLLQSVIEGTNDAVILRDLEGRFRLINPAAAAILQKPAEELAGKSNDDVFSPEDARRLRDQDRQVIETGEPLTVEHTLLINGSPRRFLTTKAAQRDASGQIVGVIDVSQDITEFKQAQEQLRRSERLASIGTLAAGIAHEINNPVGGILLSAQGALGETENRDFVTQCLNEIAEDAKRCGRIIQSILQFARQEPSEKLPSDVNALLKRAVDLTRKSAEHLGGALSLQLGEDLPVIAVNPTGFEQVLVNLIQNALDAGGRRITIRTERLDDAVRVTVADDGPGMALQQLEHIFDPFYTTRQQKAGTGLGLSVAHGIIQAHGGRIEVQSQPRQATAFTIELPGSQGGGGADDVKSPCC